MTALPNKPYIFVEATEKLAYSTLIKNRSQIFSTFLTKGIELKDLDELKRISCLGLLLNISNPSEKTNELYKLVTAEWSYFQELGTIKDFTPNLSYRSILYVLRLYNYTLASTNTNNTMSITPIQTTKNTEFNLTEKVCYQMLLNNQTRLEASMHFKGGIEDLVKPKMLAEVLNLSVNSTENNIYNFLKEHWDTLSSLDCVKKDRYVLTFRAVVYLLQKKHYHLDVYTPPTIAPIFTGTPTAASLTVVKPIETEVTKVKPDINLLTSYIKSERAKLKLIADRDNAKAKESMTKLNMVETALLLAEDAANLLTEAGV